MCCLFSHFLLRLSDICICDGAPQQSILQDLQSLLFIRIPFTAGNTCLLLNHLGLSAVNL